MTKANRSWRKSEGGIVGRFGDPRKALRSVAIALADGAVDPSHQSFLVDRGTSLESLKPRLVPSVDHSQLSSIPAEDRENLGLSLVLRDHGLKRFLHIADWHLDDLPEVVPLDSLPGFGSEVQDRFTLTIGLVALETSASLEFGSTIARKDFHVYCDQEGNEFPHQFVDSSYFAGQGLPPTTSWFVRLLNEDGDRPAQETFIVYINKDLAEVASNRAADAVWSSIGADTFAVLLTKLLKTAPPETPASGSVLEQLDRQLSLHELTLQQVAGWVSGGEQEKVIAAAQAVCRVTTLLRGAL